MRKYQQLLLVIISITSVAILLMYKSENNRLRYVLEVVNFFGRSDAAVLDRLENNTKADYGYDFSSPLPVWQYIGDNFHTYSSFWEKKELTPGGTAISIVVGARGALVNFKCGIRYKEGKVISGKFAFVIVDTPRPQNEQYPDQFTVYKFLCKITRDFGVAENVILISTKIKAEYELSLRHIKNKEIKERAEMNVCVNMVAYNSSNTAALSEFSTKTNVMQFFLFHQTIGVDNFLVYNADALSGHTRKLLSQAGVHINFFPYNFPFDYRSAATRTILELDCTMRSMNTAQTATLLEINEFFFTGENLRSPDSMLTGLKHYDSDVNRFELTTYSVCMDARFKLLLDSKFYDPERTPGHKIYIYKLHMLAEHIKIMPLAISHAFVHVYTNCVGSKDLLHEWRGSIRSDFLQYIEDVRKEIGFMF